MFDLGTKRDKKHFKYFSGMNLNVAEIAFGTYLDNID